MKFRSFSTRFARYFPARTALCMAFAFAGGAVWSRGVPFATAFASPRAESPFAVLGQLGRVLALIENDYVEPVERSRLLNGAIKGMVEELDPHSSYMPAEEFTLFQGDTQGKFAGIGVEVGVKDDVITILSPIDGSPAARAGIRSGDVVVAVDGESVQGAQLDKLVRKMRGVPGSHVKLTLKRAGVKDLASFDLVREIIHVTSTVGKLLDGEIAYLHIKQFQERTHDELLGVIAKLRASSKGGPWKGVILDLRNNPGGLVDEAAEVSDEFLPSGLIFTTRHRGQVLDEVRAKPGGALSDVPVVVLVNEWSASASELVAGALQDHKRGVVVGANTFGKGSVQSILALPDGAGLRLTTARYYTPDGHSIQAEGVHPDVKVETPLAGAVAFPPLRERDLSGHLPAEGIPRVESTVFDAGAAPGRPVVDGGDSSFDDLRDEDVRAMPSDPSSSSDAALRVGYRLLLGKP